MRSLAVHIDSNYNDTFCLHHFIWHKWVGSSFCSFFFFEPIKINAFEYEQSGICESTHFQIVVNASSIPINCAYIWLWTVYVRLWWLMSVSVESISFKWIGWSVTAAWEAWKFNRSQSFGDRISIRTRTIVSSAFIYFTRNHSSKIKVDFVFLFTVCEFCRFNCPVVDILNSFVLIN